MLPTVVAAVSVVVDVREREAVVVGVEPVTAAAVVPMSRKPVDGLASVHLMVPAWFGMSTAGVTRV